MGQGRIAYLDAIKGICIISVVVNHTMHFCLGQTASIEQAITDFNLPLFFAISGYLTYKSQEKRPSVTAGQVVRKFAAIIFPTLCATAVLTQLLRSTSSPVWEFRSFFAVLRNYYWFTYTLFAFYLLFLFLQFLSKQFSLSAHWLIHLCVLLGAILFLWGNTGCLAGSSILQTIVVGGHKSQFVFYILGIGLAENREKIKASRLFSLSLYFVPVLLLCSIPHIMGSSLLMERVRCLMMGVLCVWIVWSGLRSADGYCTNHVWYRWVFCIGRHTLAIYLLHYFFLLLISVIIQ